MLEGGSDGPKSESELETSWALSGFFGFGGEPAGGSGNELVGGKTAPMGRDCLENGSGEELRERFAGGEVGLEEEELLLRFVKYSGGSVGPIVAIWEVMMAFTTTSIGLKVPKIPKPDLGIAEQTVRMVDVEDDIKGNGLLPTTRVLLT